MSRLSATIVLLSVLITATVHGQTTLTARVDRKHVTVFDRLTYTLILESSDRGAANPVPPEFNGFKQLGPPQTSSQFSWVNGKTTSSKTYTYTLEATKEGSYVLGPARVKANGQVIQSTPVKVMVAKAGSAQNLAVEDDEALENLPTEQMQSLFLRTVVETETPYVGQPVTVSTYLYTRVNISDYRLTQQPDYSGFWVENTELPRQPVLHQKLVKGVEFGVAKMHEVVLFPTVTGELVIPPLNMKFRMRSNQRNMNDFFNSPFRSNIMGSRWEQRNGQAVSLKVRPLPVTGKPATFAGSVGQFKIRSEVNETSVKTGDAIVIRVTISGENGLQTLSAPVISDMDDFKLFDPKSEDVVPDMVNPDMMQKTWEYILVPYKAGDFEVQPIAFSYFDPKIEQYQTISTKPFSVHVESAPNAAAGYVYDADNEVIKLLNVDIRYIKTSGQIVPWRPLYVAPWFVGLMCLPLVVVPVLFIAITKKRRLEGDTAYARGIKARSVSGKRFAQAIAHLNAGRLDEALDDTAAAYARYLSDRLGLPLGGITLANVMKELSERMVDESITGLIQEYWDKLETTRYAPIDTERDVVTELIENGQTLVEKLDKIKFKKSGKDRFKGDNS